MAIRIIDQYPLRSNAATADYPHGSIKNETTPGANDGTPLDQAWGNDIGGFLQSLLDEASITPSGAPDKVGASQYLDALSHLIAQGFGIGGASTNDYVVLPYRDRSTDEKKSLILQWGYGSVPGGGASSLILTYPVAFPNACLGGVISSNNGVTPAQHFDGNFRASKTQLSILSSAPTGAGAVSVSYLAIGH